MHTSTVAHARAVLAYLVALEQWRARLRACKESASKAGRARLNEKPPRMPRAVQRGRWRASCASAATFVQARVGGVRQPTGQEVDLE